MLISIYVIVCSLAFTEYEGMFIPADHLRNIVIHSVIIPTVAMFLGNFRQFLHPLSCEKFSLFSRALPKKKQLSYRAFYCPLLGEKRLKVNLAS